MMVNCALLLNDFDIPLKAGCSQYSQTFAFKQISEKVKLTATISIPLKPMHFSKYDTYITYYIAGHNIRPFLTKFFSSASF